jgi:ubiquinone/menaquinone biosynthesis C-methylase UbiE
MSLDAATHAQLKARQHATWSAGDFAAVGSLINIVGEILCETVDLRSGERVLDIATGSGNTALAAARRFTDTTGVDFIPALLERARARAEAEGLPVEFVEGDAEALPIPDASVDVVLSTFGVMFAPDHRLAAAEIRRVLKPGGRAGLAAWLPEGAAGAMFRTAAAHLPPPPPGFTPPVLWATESHVRELFPDAQVEVIPRPLRLRFPSAEFWLQYFRQHFGPIIKAYEVVGPDGEEALTKDLLAMAADFNVSGDGTLVLQQDYAEVIVRP